MTDSGDGHRVEVIGDLVALEAVRPLWEQSQQHPLADYEFFQMILRVRAASSRPLVLVVHRDDRPVALLVGRIDAEHRPLRLGYASLGGVRIQQLRFIAGGFLGQTTPAQAARLVDAVARVLHDRSLQVAVFEQLAAGSVLHQALVERFGAWRRGRLSGESPHWQLTLPATWEAFLQARGGKHRYWLKRLPRILDSDFPGRWQVACCSQPEDVEGFLLAAESVAVKTYHRALQVGFRHDAEYGERVMLDAQRQRLRGYLLMIDGQACAFWYCVVYAGTLHLMATAHDPQHKRHELGTVLLMQAFRDQCGKGTRQVDFGLGDAGYKQRFGSSSVLEGPTSLFASSASGLALHAVAAAGQAVRGVAKAVLEATHATQRVKTLWRRRIAAPAAPARERPAE